MKKLLLSFALFGFLGLVTGCAGDLEPPGSPCVGAKNSPCDWHKPTNNA